MKICIQNIRPGFSRIKFLNFIKKHLESDLNKAKKTADVILSKQEFKSDLIDVNMIQEIGSLGLNLYFSYWDCDDFIEGSFDGITGLHKYKVQTTFSISEIEDCLSALKNPILVGTHKDNYSIMEDTEPPTGLLIENHFLAKHCVEYLISKNVKIYKLIKDLG